jgi:hypothetical protein
MALQALVQLASRGYKMAEIRIRRTRDRQAVRVIIDGTPSAEMTDAGAIAAFIARAREAKTRLIEAHLSNDPASIIGESVIEYYEREV